MPGGPNSAGGLIASPGRINIWVVVALVLLLAGTAFVLFSMGRVAICKCGTVKFWHSVVNSSENSQHLADWYTLSHIVHGFLFYGAAWLIGRIAGWRIPVAVALMGAVAVEAAWEIFENTEFVINRYREATISLDYFGDSIVNSISDIVAMIAGFMLASLLPVAASILSVIGLEVFAAFMIRDNLMLNILMLVKPLEAIKIWQQGG